MRCTLSVLVLLAAAVVAEGAEWPQWLGPARDGSSTEKIAPWTTPPKILWRQPVGEGHSSPVVAEGKVFLHTKVRDKEEEELTAWDAATGKHLWSVTYAKDKFTTPFGNGPRSTPTVADGKVFTFGITGVLACFNAVDGKLLWRVDTLKEFETKNLFFGMSCSPLVEEKRVIVQVGGKGAGIVAFDVASGKVAWKALDDTASYASPIAFGAGNGRQVVFLTGKNVVGLNPADGKLRWDYPYADKLFESSSTPVRVGNLIVASSITLGSVGIGFVVDKLGPTALAQWKNPALTCYFATPVPVGSEHIYVVTGTNPLAFPKKTEAHLWCLETKTGKDLWKKAGVGKYHATLLRTGDDKLLMLDDVGNLMLLDPNPKEYRELARAKVCGDTWAHPALANGRLYIRDGKEILCLELPGMCEVTGKLLWPDGKPATELAGYSVKFDPREAKVSAAGIVEVDGTFRLGTFKPNDGVPRGNYAVAIAPPLPDAGKPAPRSLLPARYQSPKTSGLVVTIEGDRQEVPIKVERLKK